MNILVVDDDKYFLERIKYLLELDNHSITATPSPIEALQLLSCANFDLVLTDLKMPYLSGIEFYKKARNIENSSEFIVITGYGTINSAIEAIKAGVYDYLLKPFEMSKLRNKIREVEGDLQLREKLLISKNMKESAGHDSDFQIIKNRLKVPYLVISCTDPDILIKSLNLDQAIPVLLSSKNGANTLSLHNLDSVGVIIEEFVAFNSEGSIIFEGIEKLSQIENWRDIKEFLSLLQTKIHKTNLQLIILLTEKNRSPSTKKVLSFITSLPTTRIAKIISHPIRKNIIQLLNSMYELNFNAIFTELSNDSPSVLAFHIKKLIEEDIVIKKENNDSNYYHLSPKGEYLAKIIENLKELGVQSPFIPIKIIEI
ncbi:MAG: response regulator [Candidatus Hodarchaeales archaeon]